MNEKTIYKIETFANGEGKGVQSLSPIDGLAPKIFKGTAVLRTPHGPYPANFDFSESVTTVEECFEKFEDELRAALKKEQEQQRIITPPARENGGLILP